MVRPTLPVAAVAVPAKTVLDVSAARALAKRERRARALLPALSISVSPLPPGWLS